MIEVNPENGTHIKTPPLNSHTKYANSMEVFFYHLDL